jgi:uncharacterized membrane protein
MARTDRSARTANATPPTFRPWATTSAGPESRLWALGATVVIVLGQWYVSRALGLEPSWLFPAVVAVLFGVSLTIYYLPTREEHHRSVRGLSVAASSVVAIANALSLAALVFQVFSGKPLVAAAGLLAGHRLDPVHLLLVGLVLWLVDTLNFAIIYWELDSGGPIGRAAGTQEYPDFLFMQQQQRGLGPDDWKPTFTDYLYVSLTCATAFSPTDTMPMSGKAKLAMGVESLLSISILAVLVARAVNVATG